ncbi:hypothetical protein GQ54DRAFT_245471, partial [Martensiomyces pterosporus]
SMWSFLGRGQTTVTCWFCNEKTRLPRSDSDRDTKHDWYCDRCENQNTIDSNGNVVDSREEMFRESPMPSRRSASKDPDTRHSSKVFCDTCQRNQELVRQVLSEYLPDEND